MQQQEAQPRIDEYGFADDYDDSAEPRSASPADQLAPGTLNLLTYRKLPFTDKLWTLYKNKGHFIILESNSGLIKWPYFLPKVNSL